MPSFNEASVWKISCNSNAADLTRTGSLGCIAVLCNRDAGVATLLFADGNGKRLREIAGFADTSQHSAHFWYSPAIAKITGEATKSGRYRGWIEGFGPSFFSVRTSGEAVWTTHDIIFGGMQARSSEWTCDIVADEGLN
jgi:hypothetical protein